MNAYTAAVEAHGYGDVEAEVSALEDALTGLELGDDVTWTVMGDDTRGMLLMQLKLEGISAVDVHELAFQLWEQAWDQAFSEQAPTDVLAIRCVPVGVGAPA